MASPNNWVPDISSLMPPTDGFMFTPTDDTVILTPSTALPVIARALTTRDSGDVQVTYQSGRTAIVPFIAGQRRSMIVTKIFATNTTADIVTHGILVEL